MGGGVGWGGGGGVKEKEELTLFSFTPFPPYFSWDSRENQTATYYYYYHIILSIVYPITTNLNTHCL